MKTTQWNAYHDLAWISPILAPPEEYKEDAELYSAMIQKHATRECKTLLHFGCGAGGNDYTFKNSFQVTGVDSSKSMLDIAKKLNPEVSYIHGDMRSIQLNECFDAVGIPDSIGHMTTLEDLHKAIALAYLHLKPGGVLLITAHIQEEFQSNNFVYSGSKDNIEITAFENNYHAHSGDTTYEATLMYLIRNQGVLEIHSGTDTIGLFSLSTWLKLFSSVGFEIKQKVLEHSYDPYIVGKGKYLLRLFICCKPL